MLPPVLFVLQCWKKSSSKGLPRWRSGKTQLSMQKIEETQVLGRDPLEKEMAKHSCILA